MTSPSARRLEGKRVMITGAASGMGRAGAELFARHGAIVAVVDHDEVRTNDTVEAIEKEGGRACGVVADLLSVEESQRAVRDSAVVLGGLDALWANAGMPGPHGIGDLDYAAVRRCIDLNALSVLASAEAALEHLRQGSRPAMLFTASVSALVGSRFNPVYAMTKFAVVGLAKSLAVSLGPEEIRVNALCPGVTETPMMSDFMSEAGRAGYMGATPLGRTAQPEDVAAAALWLLSDESGYVSGAAVPVDGGFTAG